MFLRCFFSPLHLCRLIQFVLRDFDAFILHPDLIYMVLLGPAEEKQPRLTVMVDGDLGIHSLVSTTRFVSTVQRIFVFLRDFSLCDCSYDAFNFLRMIKGVLVTSLKRLLV